MPTFISAVDSLTSGLMQRCHFTISHVNWYQDLPFFYFHRSEVESLGTRLCIRCRPLSSAHHPFSSGLLKLLIECNNPAGVVSVKNDCGQYLWLLKSYVLTHNMGQGFVERIDLKPKNIISARAAC